MLSPADWIALFPVTPQAKNTGTSSLATVTGSPKSTFCMSHIPMSLGSPMWTGAPWNSPIPA